MEGNYLLQHTKKVNRSIIVFMSIMALGRIGAVAMGIGRTAAVYATVFLMIATIATALTLHIKKKAPQVVSVFLIGCYFLTTLQIMENKGIGVLVIILGLCLVALYLNKRMMVVYSLSSVIAFFIIYQLSQIDYKLDMAFITFTTGILFFVCKWGSELIGEAERSNSKSGELLVSLDRNMKVTKEQSLILDQQIAISHSDIKVLSEMSKAMEKTIQDITLGTVEQSEDLSGISNGMDTVNEKIADIQGISKKLYETSYRTSYVVKEGHKRVNALDNQMEEIQESVGHAVNEMFLLRSDINEVNRFFNDIVEISEQTNLLALNAAIEAARAGSYGSGFAVVADEVKKLATQSADTAKEIDGIIKTINLKAESLLSTINEVTETVKNGSALTQEVNQGFSEVDKAYHSISTFIEEETDKVTQLTEVFSSILSQTENIAGIAMEHSAATEEMTATSNEQTAHIKTLLEIMTDLTQVSHKLQDAFITE